MQDDRQNKNHFADSMPPAQFMQADPQRLQREAIVIRDALGLFTAEFAVSPAVAVTDGFRETLKTTGYRIDPAAQIAYEVHLQAFCCSVYAPFLPARISGVVQFAVEIRNGGQLIISRTICDRKTLVYWDAVEPAAGRVFSLCLEGAIRSAIADPNLIAAIEEPTTRADKAWDNGGRDAHVTTSRPSAKPQTTCELANLPTIAIAPSLAVLDLNVADDLNANDGEVLADLCRKAVLDSQRFTLVDRQAMKALLEEEDLAQSVQCDDTRCLVNYGRKLRAQKIVYGKLNRLGQSLTITVTMVDVSSAKIDAMETEMAGESIEGLADLIEPMTCRLLKTALEKSR